MEKKRQGETQCTTKIDGFLSFAPLVLWSLFVFLESHPVCDQIEGFNVVFSLFY